MEEHDESNVFTGCEFYFLSASKRAANSSKEGRPSFADAADAASGDAVGGIGISTTGFAVGISDGGMGMSTVGWFCEAALAWGTWGT